MPKNMFAIGTGLVLVGAALQIIVGALSKTGGMTWEEIGKGLVTLAGSMIILSVSLKTMKGTLGAAASILVVANALLILVPMLKLLGSMSLANIGKSLLMLAGTFTVLGVAAKFLGALVKPMYAVAGAVALLGAGLFLLASALTMLTVNDIVANVGGSLKEMAWAVKDMFNMEKLVVMAKAMLAFMKTIFLGVIDIIVSNIDAISNAVKTIITAVLDVVLTCAPQIVKTLLKLISELLKSLSEELPTIIDTVIDLLIGIMEALAKRMPELISAAMNLIAAFFGGIIEELKKVDPEVLLETLAGIGLVAAMIAAFSAISSMIPAALVGIAGAGLAVAEIAGIIAVFGGIAQIPGVEWLISEGGNLLQAIGTAIGQFVGGIVGGVMKGISSQLPGIGSDLSAFMDNAAGFIEGAKALDPGILTSINAFAGAILALTAANLLDSLTKWITGGHSLVKFGTELSEFGPEFKKFAKTVEGIDTKVVTASATAASALGEMYSKLPSNGGLAEKIFGTRSLKEFAVELKEFGPAMKDYANSVKGLDTNAVTASASAAQMMSDMASKIPNTGGVVATIIGDNTLSAFGEELRKFGPALSQYAWFVSGINPSVVAASAGAAQMLVDLSNTIPNTGGLIDFFTGSNDIGAFGEKLKSFGESFSLYYESVKDISTGKLHGVYVELTNLISVANGAAAIDTSGLDALATNLRNFGNAGVDQFIEAFTKATDRVATAVNGMVSTAKENLSNKKNDIVSVGETLCNNLSRGITLKKPFVLADVLNLCNAVILGLKNNLPANTVRGIVSDQVMLPFGATVVGLKIGILSSVTLFCNQVLSTMRDVFTPNPGSMGTWPTYYIGSQAMQGFVEGLRSKTADIRSAAEEMANIVPSATAKALDEHSPAKVMVPHGRNVVLGFVKGIAGSNGLVQSATKTAADSAIEIMRETISKISDLVYDDLNTQPVIRPVLDASEIQNGIRGVNGLMTRGINLGISYRKASAAITAGDTDGSASGSVGQVSNNYSFTQNNYSPKALSAKEIYRQTRNQFTAMKGRIAYG